MAQRYELFSIRNIIFVGLILTVLYGTYSYNNMRNRLSVSHANFLTMRSEVAQGANQIKAAMKSRMSCMKDLKQMRTTMWELRSKMSDLETESNKQKHDVESKLLSLRKESDSWKSQYEDLQKELMKLKEDDKAKLAKNREETEESKMKLRKLVTENDMALSKLKDSLQDVKSENERLKVALAAAKRRISKSGDSTDATNPKHSDGEEPPRQVMPPGMGRHADKKDAKELSKNDENLRERKNDSNRPKVETPDVNDPKRSKVEAPDANDPKRPKVEAPEGNDSKNSNLDIPDGKNIGQNKAADSVVDNKLDVRNRKSGESQVSNFKSSDNKSLTFKDRKENAEANPNIPENKEGINPGIESRRRTNFQAALDKIRQAKAAAAKEEAPQQQVDMPIPHAAARRNNEPNQLPQPVQPAAAVDANKKKAPAKSQGGGLEEDEHLL